MNRNQNNKRKAVFGKPAEYYENSRMIRRAQRLRVGRKVVLNPDSYIGTYTRETVGSKVGTIIQLRNGDWDCVVRFPNVRITRPGIYGFYADQVRVVK